MLTGLNWVRLQSLSHQLPPSTASIRLSRSLQPAHLQWQPAPCLRRKFADTRHDSPFYTTQYQIEPADLQFPRGENRADTRSWIALLDTISPSDEERTGLSQSQQASSDSIILSQLLIRARGDANLDILSHLGLVEGRWEIVSWIVKTISGMSLDLEGQVGSAILESGIQWPVDSLDAMTFKKFEPQVQDANAPSSTHISIDNIWNSDSSSLWAQKEVQTRGLGQIWRSLGNLILNASVLPAPESRKIMPHVLSALATLHHNGIISDSVYSFPGTTVSAALYQPPTLHLLSSRILEALSDAAWYTHATWLDSASKSGSPRIPRYGIDRYKFLVDELGHEVWLELVLWSCLHGDWVDDGAAILDMMSERPQWSVLSWRHAVSRMDKDSSATTLNWSALNAMLRRRLPQPDQDIRGVVERTVSSEVVAAYVDGLLNIIRVGVPHRGLPVRTVLNHVKKLKLLLDKQNMGLGYTTWDAICVRFVESGGFDVDDDPQTLLDVLTLTQPFGRELVSENLKLATKEEVNLVPSYVFDASAVALGLLHRAIDVYSTRGDVDGALRAFGALQHYTDLNKQRSLEAFFRDLQEGDGRGDSPSNSDFSSNLSAAEYPAYHPQIPATILSGLLEMFAEAKLFQLGDWMIYSKEVDRPIISRTMYDDPVISAALIRYATARGDKRLLSNVIKAHASLGKEGINLPNAVLAALLQSQIIYRQWDSVENILNYLAQSTTQFWHPRILCDVAHEILLLQKGITNKHRGPDPQSLTRATAIFRGLLQWKYGLPARLSKGYDPVSVLHSIVGVLSSISKEWADFCAGLSPRHGSQPLRLHVQMFDALLDGVVVAFGVQAGKKLWDTWCANVEKKQPSMLVPSRPPSIADTYFDEDARVVLSDLPDGKWVFRSKIKPQLSTVRVLLRGILEKRGSFDVETAPEPGNRDDVLVFALDVLEKLTDSKEAASRELQRLTMARKWQPRSEHESENDQWRQLDT